MTKEEMIGTLKLWVFACFFGTLTAVIYGLAIYTLLRVFGVTHD
jgi:hypothetical protein